MLDAKEDAAGTTMECPYCLDQVIVPTSATAGPVPDPVSPTAITTPEQAFPVIKADPDTAAIPPVTSPKDSPDPVPEAGLDVSKPPRRIGKRLLVAFLVLVAVGCVGVTVALVIRGVLPYLAASRQTDARKQTAADMRLIGLAWYQYEEKHQPPALPSPRMVQPQVRGNTTGLSWRVAILPYLEAQSLFEQFDLTKDWNHPRNQPCWDKRPHVYECPWAPPTNQTMTPFQCFTGPKTLFPEDTKQVRLEDIPDGTAHTILFAQAANPVVWTKAQDMVIAPVPAWPSQPEALPLPRGRFLVVMADATVRVIDRNKMTDDTLRSLIDPRDGAKPALDWNDLER
jgi:hypothetical protein